MSDGKPIFGVSMRSEPQRPYLVDLILGGCPAGSSFVCNDLFEALDAVVGESGYAVFTDAIDPKAAVFGFQVDLSRATYLG